MIYPRTIVRSYFLTRLTQLQLKFRFRSESRIICDFRLLRKSIRPTISTCRKGSLSRNGAAQESRRTSKRTHSRITRLLASTFSMTAHRWNRVLALPNFYSPVLTGAYRRSPEHHRQTSFTQSNIHASSKIRSQYSGEPGTNQPVANRFAASANQVAPYLQRRVRKHLAA